MLDNLTIRRKGLLIVGIPAFAQTVLAILLFLQVQQCERLTHQASKSARVISLYLQMNISNLNLMKAMLAYRLTHSGKVGLLLTAFRQQGDYLVGEIGKLVDDPREMEFFNNLRNLRSLGRDNLSLGAEAIMSHWGQEPARDEFFTFFSTFNSLVDSLARLQALEEQRARQIGQRLATESQVVGHLLVLNCLVGLASVVTIMVISCKSFSARLSVLMENTIKIAKGQALSPPVSGRDEIAQLDAAIHAMNHTLKEAEGFRRDTINMLSHDLRSPLTSIRMFFESLLAGCGGQLTAVGQDRANQVVNSLISLGNLVDELLDTEKLREGKLEFNRTPVELRHTLVNCVETFRVFADEHKVDLVTELKTVPLVSADPARIAQVINNFLSNAIKFSPPGGRVTVTLDTQAHSVRVRVIDEGPGVTEAERQLLFDAFEQGETANIGPIKGSGLGLAIARGIVEAHHGRIGIISEQRKGACFWFTLPIDCH